jgi:hypothetical protein
MRQVADDGADRVTAGAPAGMVSGASIGRSRHSARAKDVVLPLQRCLTCKMELGPGVERYCNDACRLKQGRSKRAPGRTASRRRRRRGGRKR